MKNYYIQLRSDNSWGSYQTLKTPHTKRKAFKLGRQLKNRGTSNNIQIYIIREYSL